MVSNSNNLKTINKSSDDKIIKLAANAPIDEFRLVGERVQKGELRWIYYAIDNDKGYHHYLPIKK